MGEVKAMHTRDIEAGSEVEGPPAIKISGLPARGAVEYKGKFYGNGDVIVGPDARFAVAQIQAGRAVAIHERFVVDHREPVAEHRDPQRKRRKRG